MTDVAHELGSLRHVVESSLSSKVAMFNNQVQQHKASQHLNPFSNPDGRASPKPTFGKDDYGKPLAGSLTEMRGQKANMHVMREMLELCQIINSEGYEVKDEPNMRVIPFGELFNIYNYISDKVVGILLRARKHKLLEFEGEMLFQRRDDDVPIFLLRPIAEIRKELNEKIEAIKRASSPVAPQATSVLLDKSAHEKKLKESGLTVDGGKKKSRSLSPSPAKIKEESKKVAEAPAAVDVEKVAVTKEATKPAESTVEIKIDTPLSAVKEEVEEVKPSVELKVEEAKPIMEKSKTPEPPTEHKEKSKTPEPTTVCIEKSKTPEPPTDRKEKSKTPEPPTDCREKSKTPEPTTDRKEKSKTPEPPKVGIEKSKTPELQTDHKEKSKTPEPSTAHQEKSKTPEPTTETTESVAEATSLKVTEAAAASLSNASSVENLTAAPADVNNNNEATAVSTNIEELPTIVIEASAVFVRGNGESSPPTDTETVAAAPAAV